jgi:septum formation protein
VRLLLASRSPRRADLLTGAGFEFDVAQADVDETARPNERPDTYVARVARAKAALAAAGAPDRVVLGADTAVVIDGCILGKPEDARDAADMLRRLSGRVHEVLTGVTLLSRQGAATDVAVTAVEFAPLTGREIDWYVGTGEPYGKAGGYAIQGRAARFVTRIDGSYSNVVGLPIALVYRLLPSIDPERESAIS